MTLVVSGATDARGGWSRSGRARDGPAAWGQVTFGSVFCFLIRLSTSALVDRRFLLRGGPLHDGPAAWNWYSARRPLD